MNRYRNMKSKLPVFGLLLAVTSLAVAEMKTWTFEKNRKTIEGEVVGFSGNAVNLKGADGKIVSVPIAYLTASNRADLAAARVSVWKEVGVLKLEGSASAGRYRKCVVQGKDVNGSVLIDLLPSAVEAILNIRNQQAAQIARLASQVETRARAAEQADAVTPVATGPDAALLNSMMPQRAQVDLALAEVARAKAELERLEAAHADYLDKTKAATTVKMKRTPLIYEGLPVWECFDPRKREP
jgi:hypothetical protein